MFLMFQGFFLKEEFPDVGMIPTKTIEKKEGCWRSSRKKYDNPDGHCLQGGVASNVQIHRFLHT